MLPRELPGGLSANFGHLKPNVPNGRSRRGAVKGPVSQLFGSGIDRRIKVCRSLLTRTYREHMSCAPRKEAASIRHAVLCCCWFLLVLASIWAVARAGSFGLARPSLSGVPPTPSLLHPPLQTTL